MDFLVKFIVSVAFLELILKMVTPITGAILLAVFGRWRKRHREYQDMRHRQTTHQTRMVLCGVFEKSPGVRILEFDPLGVFRTIHFGEVLFNIIDLSMKGKKSGLIVPEDSHASAHLREMLFTEGSSLLLQCNRIDAYLDGEITIVGAYRCVNMIACLVNLPTQNSDWEHLPCVLIIEESMLKAVRANSVSHNPKEPHGEDILDILRMLATQYFSGENDGIAVFTTPTSKTE